MPVLHDPETVVNVHAANPDGVAMLSRSKIAGPPAIVRFAVLKAVIGNEVPMSLIVPAVPNIGSLLDTVVPVIAPAQVDAPEKAIHEA